MTMRQSWPDSEDAAGRFAQGSSAALQGGALVAGHGRFMHLLDPAGAEHADQRQGHLIAWRIGGHRQDGTRHCTSRAVSGLPPAGIGISKDVWMLGIGLSLLADIATDGRVS
jgi:hypothetical protein